MQPTKRGQTPRGIVTSCNDPDIRNKRPASTKGLEGFCFGYGTSWVSDISHFIPSIKVSPHLQKSASGRGYYGLSGSKKQSLVRWTVNQTAALHFNTSGHCGALTSGSDAERQTASNTGATVELSIWIIANIPDTHGEGWLRVG